MIRKAHNANEQRKSHERRNVEHGEGARNASKGSKRVAEKSMREREQAKNSASRPCQDHSERKTG